MSDEVTVTMRFEAAVSASLTVKQIGPATVLGGTDRLVRPAMVGRDTTNVLSAANVDPARAVSIACTLQ